MKREPSLAERFSADCGPYAPMVYRHCLQMLKRPHEAEDAAQESMLRAFRAYERYRGDGLATWLYRIAHNTCLDVLKSARMKRETFLTGDMPPPADPAPTPEEAYLNVSAKEALWEAVSKLPLDYQTLLALYYGENMSYQELSRALALPEGTVKSRLNRAKENLRKLYRPEDDNLFL